MNLKLRPQLLEIDKVSYASDHIDLPENGVDCGEGCTPYGFPSEVTEAAKRFDWMRVGPYPHSTAIYDGLTEFWKGYFSLKPENLIITDGSISAIYTVVNSFTQPGAKIIGVAPQFTDFEMAVQMNGMYYQPVVLKRENAFVIDPQEIIAAMDPETSLVYIDNPNNPTGQVIDIDSIRMILDKALLCGTAVVIDEAYGDFMPKKNSAVNLVESYENLIVLRTLSKAFGLAGLRIGYIITNEQLIAAMNKLTNPYQVSELARELGGVALKNAYQIPVVSEDFAKMKREIISTIGSKLHIAQTCDTVSIFLLQHEDETIDLRQLFYDKGVLCVSGSDFRNLNQSYVRIRLPRIDEFPILLNAIREINAGI